MRKTLAAALGLFAFAASPAQAQVPDWTERIRLGRPLFVTLADGGRVDGVAGSVSVDGIVVATPAGVMTARFDEIRLVERRDSVRNGIFIGAAIGAGIGLAAVLDSSCGPYNTTCPEAAAVPIGGALYGALIGWGVDALIRGRTVVFDRSRAPRVAIAPTRGGAVGRVTFSW